MPKEEVMLKEDERIDDLERNGYRIIQNPGRFCFGMDAVLLSGFAKVKDGDVVLMHELYSQTGDAALQLIPELVNRGYQLVTVSEMAAAKGYPLVAGNLYSSFP